MCVDVCTVRVLVFSRASNVGISVGWELGTLILERALALTLLDLLLLRVPLTPQQHTEQTPASVYMHVSNRSCPQKTQKLNPRYFLRVIKQRRRRDGGTSTGGPAGGPGGGQRRRRDGWQRDGPVRHHHTFCFFYSRHDHPHRAGCRGLRRVLQSWRDVHAPAIRGSRTSLVDEWNVVS